MWAQDSIVLTNRELGVIYQRSTVQFIFFVREIPHSQLHLAFTPHKKNTTENHRHHWAVSKDKKIPFNYTKTFCNRPYYYAGMTENREPSRVGIFILQLPSSCKQEPLSEAASFKLHFSQS